MHHVRPASEGAGLGVRFLGHVERTAVLIHLVDATQEDVGEAWRTVRHELEAYGAELADKPEILALNKIDALDEETIAEKAAELKAAAGVEPRRVSGFAGMGVGCLLGGIACSAGLVRRTTWRAASRPGRRYIGLRGLTQHLAIESLLVVAQRNFVNRRSVECLDHRLFEQQPSPAVPDQAVCAGAVRRQRVEKLVPAALAEHPVRHGKDQPV